MLERDGAGAVFLPYDLQQNLTYKLYRSVAAIQKNGDSRPVSEAAGSCLCQEVPVVLASRLVFIRHLVGLNGGWDTILENTASHVRILNSEEMKVRLTFA